MRCQERKFLNKTVLHESQRWICKDRDAECGEGADKKRCGWLQPENITYTYEIVKEHI